VCTPGTTRIRRTVHSSWRAFLITTRAPRSVVDSVRYFRTSLYTTSRDVSVVVIRPTTTTTTKQKWNRTWALIGMFPRRVRDMLTCERGVRANNRGLGAEPPSPGVQRQRSPEAKSFEAFVRLKEGPSCQYAKTV